MRKIVAQAELADDDVVLEIGPGLGSLTLGLLDAGHQVIAVEIDPRLANLLPRTVAERLPERAESLHVVCADALEIDAALPNAPTAMVANLPYNVSVPVLLHLLRAIPSLERLLVMVQAEVAARLAARPGSRTYGVPSAKVAWYAQARLAGSIGRGVFWPVPNVDSALVKLDRRSTPTEAVTAQQVFEIIDVAFAQRRKMLRAALAALPELGGSSANAVELLEAAGVDPTARAETLDIRQFAAIATARDGLRGRTPLI